jgi:peptidoglycan/xylan/chitin deacetylase (PgdA/CDA1 family)
LTQLASFTPSPKEFIRVKPPVKKVALTFDAGSDDKGVDGILEQLKKHNVRATFFLTGQFCEKFPEAAKRIAEAGMEIGNHSYSHPDFTKLDNDKIREQLEKTDSIIQKTCGKSTKPLFRFPFGARDKRTCATVTEAGYQSIYWSVDSLDSIKPKKSADFLAERVIKRIQDGGISLMHVSTEEASPALERIFEYLDTQEIHVVTVSELLLISKDQQEKEAEHRLANAAKTKATQKPPLPAR